MYYLLHNRCVDLSLFGIDSTPSKYRAGVTVNDTNTILFSSKNDDVLSGRSDIFDDWSKITPECSLLSPL